MKLSIWVTRNCNMKCRYCYEDSIIRYDERVDEDMYINKCIEFINSTCDRISNKRLFIKFFGGEPLLKFDYIKRFVDELNSKLSPDISVYYSITTNGTLMNEKVIDWFKNNDIECALSIDGDEKINDINRCYKDGTSVWKKIAEVIPYIVSKDLKLSARMTYNSKTANNLFESMNYLYGMGFTNFKALPDYFDQYWTSNNLANLKEQLRLVYKFKETKPQCQISLDDDDLLIGRKGCAGGYSMFSIDRNGDIYPCTYVVDNPTFILGNIFVSSQIELKYTDNSKIIRQDCVGCRYYKCCKSAKCLYGNYKMTGSFDNVNDFFCSYRKILYELMEERQNE